MPSGAQAFQVTKPGFLDRPYAAGTVVMDDVAGPPHNVMVAANMPDLVLTLTPTNAIRGQVELSTEMPHRASA